MKAVVFHKPHVPLSIEDVDLEGPKSGEVMVEMVGTGACHSDYHFVAGVQSPAKVPFVMGHEGAGIVKEVGPGVTNVAPGDHVVLSMDAICGYCRNCALGRPTLCETYGRMHTMPDGTTRFSKGGVPYYSLIGTFSERTVVVADRVIKVRNDVPLEKACLIGCAVITGVGAVVRRAKVEEGRTVAVFGCGGVGLNVVQGAVLASASKIIAVDQVDFKLEMAERMGATHLVKADSEDPVSRIAKITNGGADYAFEVVGIPALVRQAFDSVRPGGTAVMVGWQPAGAEVSVDAWSLLMNRGLLGAYHGAADTRVDFGWLLDLYMDGRLKLDELITRYRPLEEVNEAFDDMTKGLTARTVLTFK
jgi:S-(hydroxymethyl)glutathione dehydrogenase/alcohol dehydrogenase